MLVLLIAIEKERERERERERTREGEENEQANWWMKDGLLLLPLVERSEKKIYIIAANQIDVFLL